MSDKPAKKSKNSSSDVGLLAGRLPIGLFFFILGLWKVRGGVDQFVTTWIGHVPANVPHDLALHYLQCVPWLEMVVGAMLIAGVLSRVGAFLGAAMVTTFAIGATGWRGPNPNLPFDPNLIYIGLLLMIMFVGPGRMSLDLVIFKRRGDAPAPSKPHA